MEGAVLAIHFIPSFIVFAFAEGWPFRLAKAVTHKAPFTSPLGTVLGTCAIIARPQGQDGLVRTRS